MLLGADKGPTFDSGALFFMINRQDGSHITSGTGSDDNLIIIIEIIGADQNKAAILTDGEDGFFKRSHEDQTDPITLREAAELFEAFQMLDSLMLVDVTATNPIGLYALFHKILNKCKRL